MKIVDVTLLDRTHATVPSLPDVRRISFTRSDLETITANSIGCIFYYGSVEGAIRVRKELDSVLANMKKKEANRLPVRIMIYHMPKGVTQFAATEIMDKLINTGQEIKPWFPSAGYTRGELAIDVVNPTFEEQEVQFLGYTRIGCG